MLKICPKLPGQKFKDPSLEEEILSFIRDLRQTGEIKFLSDVNVNHMYQPWTSFSTIINKYLSGKTTALESLRLSRAQILWRMYHNKNVDYVYLLQKNQDFNKVAKPIKKKQLATTLKEKCLNVLSEAALSEAEQIKLATKRCLIQTHSSHASGSGADEGTDSSDEDDDDEVHVSEDDYNQDDDEVYVSKDDDNQNDDDADNKDDDNQNDDDADNEDDDEQNDDNADNEGDDDQDDDNEQTESDNDDDDIVHPKLSTFDKNKRQDEEDKEEEWSDDEAYDDETQGVNVVGEELDKEQTNEED
ncbi:hypothetical protein Tco_0506373 [Tanacetum coccineum]